MTMNQRVATGAFFFSMALALWGSIYPTPYALCVGLLLVTPLAAIAAVAVSNGRLTILGDGDQAQVLFVFLFTMPVCAYRAYHDVQIFSKGKPLLYALIVAVVMGLLFAAVDKRFRSGILLAILLPVVTFTYGIGLVLESDMLLDRSSPQKFVTRVLHRQINWGSRYKSYNVTLAPWGSRTEPITDWVTDRVYYTLTPGSNACISLSPGALQISWYKVEACAE